MLVFVENAKNSSANQLAIYSVSSTLTEPASATVVVPDSSSSYGRQPQIETVQFSTQHNVHTGTGRALSSTSSVVRVPPEVELRGTEMSRKAVVVESTGNVGVYAANINDHEVSLRSHQVAKCTAAFGIGHGWTGGTYK